MGGKVFNGNLRNLCENYWLANMMLATGILANLATAFRMSQGIA
jgi:hypothetical protein